MKKKYMYKVNGEFFSYGSIVAEFERAQNIILGFSGIVFSLIQSTLFFEDTSPLKTLSVMIIRLHLALIPLLLLFFFFSILVFQNYATLYPSIKQIRHVQINVASLSNMLTKSLGQCLRKCTALEDITVSSGTGSSTLKQMVKFQASHLNFESVSVEFVTILLEVSPTLLKKVHSCQK